jgi:PPP family 3-phenylpropionic acid transporter
MADARHLSTDGFALRTSVFYAVSCILIGIHLPFFPVWLQAKGFDAGQVGAILSATALLRIISVPVTTRAAERGFPLRSVIITCACATAIGFTSLGFAPTHLLIVVCTVFAAFTHTPAMALLDAYALRGLRARSKAYGPVRLWGSISFIFANLGAGIAFDLIDARQLIWLLAAAAICIAVTSLWLVPLPTVHAVHDDPHARRPLWRDPRFVAVVAAASLVQSSHAFYYGFSTIAWKAAGFDGVAIGALWALGVIAEIILFALSSRLPHRLSGVPMLTIGAAGAVVRWGIMALDPPGWSLPLLQCLHGLSFGASHLGAIAFITHTTHDGKSATAQGYFSVFQGITLSLGMLLAGLLYERIGVAGYSAMAMMALLGGVIAAIVWVRPAPRSSA